MTEPFSQPHDEPNYAGWISLGLLVGAHAIFNLLFQPFRGSETFLSMMKMGIMFTQPVLFASWLALGPPPFIKWVPLTVAAMALVFFANLPGPDDNFSEGFALIMMGFFASWAVVALIVRHFTRWIISDVTRGARSDTAATQFSVRYLLVLTAICAIVLGMGRVLALREGAPGFGGGIIDLINDQLMPMGLISLALFPALILPLIVLSRQPVTIVLFLFPLIWLMLTLLAVETISATTSESRWEIVRSVVALQTGGGLAGIISALVLRFGGYRLSRRAKGIHSTAPSA